MVEYKNYDVVCAGLGVLNFPIYPVDKGVFDQDVNPVEKIVLLPGGDAVNQSIVISNMGWKTVLLTSIGTDEFGTIMLKLIQMAGKEIDLNYIIHSSQGTGVCAMLIQKNGQRNFCTYRGGMNQYGINDMDLEVLSRTKIASIGGLMSLPGFDGDGSALFFKTAKEHGAITVADTKKDLCGIGLEGIKTTLQNTDYFFPSLEEAMIMSHKDKVEDMARLFMDCGAVHVGIKLGNKGCYYKDRETEFYLPSYLCQVVDTTGAGDNFMSGFISGILHGWTAKECCKFANAAGAICASKLGPNTAISSHEQILQFQSEHEI